ncbi:MAG: hypothetical protein CMP21_05645 [Rickettsiales bacterium]|nr:hypothetical protein [Rickettsiales bacterium]|tara:strand:+ start:3229 stop:5031 length:1803 start_codon:yes stop_codon:yes gene_type:complete
MYFTKHSLDQLPTTPGIYKMINKDNCIIYIGKAKHLKNRIKSYFSKHISSIKTKIMLKHISRIDIIETQSEKEAFILENQLIKLYKPKYNILLKDDKTFPYIKVTMHDAFPRIIVTRHKQKDGSQYYGPFPSMGSSRSLKKTLYDLFPIRDCKQPINLDTKQPKCLLLDLNKCIGPCIYKDIKPNYDTLIKQLDLLLTGRNKKLISLLKKEMIRLSHNQDYEQAAIIRDRLSLIEKLTQSQRVALDDSYSFSLWGIVESKTHYYIMVQELIDGKLISQHGFYEEKIQLSLEMFIEKTFLEYANDYVSTLNPIICTSPIASVLSPIVRLINQPSPIVPTRGIKKELLNNLVQNAQHSLHNLNLSYKPSSRHCIDTLMSLKQCLHLQHTPHLIFGFDISHLQGSTIVASSVAFKDALPYKKLYRKFSIKTPLPASNDPACIQEVVYRRLKYCLDKHASLPHLLVIDGGKSQLNFAFSSLSKLGLSSKIDIIALAKKNEDIYLLNHKKPIRLAHHSAVIHLLQHIRDESHRFAISFQRLKRNKLATQSQLLHIEGLGNKRLKALYRVFDSIESLKHASLTDISSVPGIGPRLASLILSAVKHL